MTAARSLRKLAQAVLLALAAWVLAVGVASAHGGHAGTDARPAVMSIAALPHAQDGDGTVAASALMDAKAAFVAHDGGSCPTGSPANHAEGCCTVACHAAMGAAAIDALARPNVSSSVLPLLNDMLEGRCGDRSERPPRHV
jgi:hypothetical protein